MARPDIIAPADAPVWARPNRWDGVTALIVLGLIATVGLEFQQLARPLPPHEGAIDLDPAYLPGYALRTVARMLAAMALSLAFSFAYAPLAARNPRAERVLVPLLDILQSVPVLGYIALVVALIAKVLPGSALGYELAAVFALFTSQAWNLTFSLYQSLKTVPKDLREAARAFGLSRRQTFWRLEVPFATPGLVWNAMMSMSGGWFFIVASEAITVSGEEVALPGIGSYIAAALAQERGDAVAWAVVAMLAVILIYDQVLLRPLVAWSDRFKAEAEPGATRPTAWVLTVLRRTRLLPLLAAAVGRLIARAAARGRATVPSTPRRTLVDRALPPVAMVGAALGVAAVLRLVLADLGLAELGRAALLGLATAARVLLLTALAAVVWVPIGIAVGMRPGLARLVQPVAQFLAAFPANVLFPVFVVAVLRWNLDPDIWLSPLIVLGTQWYILFNVIAGAAALPAELVLAARSLKLGGLAWWRRVALPGVFPFLVTGLITASGGAWNASVVAEAVSWGDRHLTAAGLGSYIAIATDAGDYARIALGVMTMALFVTALNRVLWRPLYALAERRYKLD
jgi:NitT/TauT family transport system permease protein